MPAPITAPIESMMRSPGPNARLSPCGESDSATSSAIGLRWKSWLMFSGQRRRLTASRKRVGDLVDGRNRDAGPRARRTETGLHHDLGEFLAVAAVSDFRIDREAVDEPLGGDPEGHVDALPAQLARRTLGERRDEVPELRRN